MSAVIQFEWLLALITATIGLELLARRLRWPPATMLILGGIVLALIPYAPEIEFDLILVLFLPPLLLVSAYFTVLRDFIANLRIILQLAIGAVALTTAIVGVVTHWILPDLPWSACFALGAIVSPPDAVAAKAVLQGLPLPPRLVLLPEGESLLNDAAGLVLYRFAVTATLTGVFDARLAGFTFVGLAAGGVLAGLACGWLVAVLLKRLRDPEFTIVITFLSAWISYMGAERLGASGVIATVTCGLVMGWRQHEVLTAMTRTQSHAVWSVIIFILESLIFILIGLALRGVLHRIGNTPEAITQYLPAIGGVVAAVIFFTFPMDISGDLCASRIAAGPAPERPLSRPRRPDHHELGRHARRRQPRCGLGIAGGFSKTRLCSRDDFHSPSSWSPSSSREPPSLPLFAYCG